MYDDFAVSSVLLDQENPRFEPTNSQREAINVLLNSDPEKTLKLARDIVNQDSLNPGEPPFVMVEDSKNIVIEGNRRITALKLLKNPDLIDEPKLRKEFVKLAATGTGPDEITAVLVERREDARHWIKLRHTGQNDGVGVTPWNSEQSNRFERRRGSQTDRAGVFCDVVARTFPDDDDLQQDIATARADRITTVGRLVGDPDVRATFGFDFIDDDLEFHFPAEEMQQIFRRIFEDLASGLSVSKIKSKEDRRTYVAAVADDHPSPSTRLPAPSPASKATGPSPTVKPASPETSSTATPPPAMNAQHPERRIYQTVRLTHVHTRTQAVLTSARKIKITEAPPVCAVMVRVILELVLTEVGVRHSWFTESEKLRRKITKAIRVLDPECQNPVKRDKALELAWIRSSTGGGEGLAVDEMNSYVHNVMAHPTAEAVQSLSSVYGPLLQRLNDYNKATPLS